MDIDEPLLSRSPGGFSSPSTSRSSRPHIKREFPSGFLDLPLPTPRGRQSTAHLLSTSDVIIPIIATAAASHPSSGSYVNLIANLNERRRLTHRSNSSPAVFTDAKESISRPMDPRPARKSNPFIVRQAFIGLILYVIIGVVVFLVSGNFKGHETYKPVDALYFTVVTLCTIGYGDIVPDTTFTKLFTCAFIIIGFGFVDILLNGLVTYICDRQEAVMLGTVDESRFNTMVRAYMVDAAKGRMRIRLKVAIALMIPVCCIAVGTIAIRYLESLPWVDSFYMAVTSVTTVGIDKRNRRIAKWVLQKKMTLGDLIAADLDHDGSISKSEFVIYKLKEMGKIAQKDIMQICDQFDLLDHTKNGKITLADLMDSD
ncbi:two-pore potassium channel 3-like isoform X2 [Punica granatum]|uniref:Two-pore potassium channel 3-like isoform X2 n=1 Tax=Punica granatum TaxID=22663 RepID=A0A6P8DJR3_PUNGR|nr:two-pore potassium channel 3-like isoform X2 [Punica granatum]